MLIVGSSLYIPRAVGVPWINVASLRPPTLSFRVDANDNNDFTISKVQALPVGVPAREAVDSVQQLFRDPRAVLGGQGVLQ